MQKKFIIDFRKAFLHFLKRTALISILLIICAMIHMGYKGEIYIVHAVLYGISIAIIVMVVFFGSLFVVRLFSVSVDGEYIKGRNTTFFRKSLLIKELRDVSEYSSNGFIAKRVSTPSGKSILIPYLLKDKEELINVFKAHTSTKFLKDILDLRG